MVVFVVRKGNPKHIESWADLVKPGVKVITPNPFSSGSARWNILAAYGQVTKSGGTTAQGEDFLRKLFANIVTQPASGREATQAFTSGTGDVLLSYENEAIFARQKGQPVDYVVPATTLLIQNPAAVTVGSPAAATSFLNYVLSTPGQTIFAQNGYRPVVPGINVTVQGANDPANPFPTPAHQFTIAQLGGWKAVTDTFFDTKTGVITAIEQQKGVPIDKK
jgi:sulfate transport system substrate-binding protein